jgi:hypothetical protein
VDRATSVFAGKSKSNFKFPKLHDASHFPHFIREFGQAASFCAAPYESAHRQYVKKPWEMSNKQAASFQGQVGAEGTPATNQMATQIKQQWPALLLA